MMKYAGAVVLALAVVTVRLDAQANDDRLRGLFDPPTYASLHAVLDSARTAGLPTEPLIDKALEGSAKHASSDPSSPSFATCPPGWQIRAPH